MLRPLYHASREPDPSRGRLRAVNKRSPLALTAVALTLVACSVIGGRPSSSPEPSSPPTPSASPVPSSTATPTGTPEPTPSAYAGLDGRQFVSVLVTENGKSRVLVPGTKARLTFSDGRVGASAGCNTMSGEYQVAGGKLVVGDLATTEMGCQPNLQAQDEWLAQLLGSRPEVALDGNNLVLTSGSTEATFLDREVAEPDQPLAGITWDLTTIIEGDIASSVPTGASATLLFTKDGQVQIDFGCNSGGGKYVVNGDVIEFSQIVSTDMACLGPKGDVEKAVTAVLNADKVTFSIDADTLTLKAGNNSLQYSGAMDVVSN
jgi:heat shock protein HslJ